MQLKQIFTWLLVAALGVVGYFFRDKLFSKGNVASEPVAETELVKSSVRIDKFASGKVDFTVTLEAKKDVVITSLRAFYFNKEKKSGYSGVGNSRRTTLDSDEMGNFDMSDEKIELKAGETKKVPAYFEVSTILDSHYIEITFNADAPCPPDMDLNDCLEKQMEETMKGSKENKIRLLQRVSEEKK